MDIDISNLSAKARKRLYRYAASLKYTTWKRMFTILLSLSLLAFSAKIGSLIGIENSRLESLVSLAGTLTLGILLIIIMIKTVNNSIDNFIQKVYKDGKFPICFECKQKLKGCEKDSCPNCGADIRAYSIPDRKTPDYPTSLLGIKKRAFKAIPLSLIVMILINVIYLLSLVICLLMFQCRFLRDSLKNSKVFFARTNALSNFKSRNIRYYEAKPSKGYRDAGKTDKTKNGIPIWYKYYDAANNSSSFFFPYILTQKEDALIFVKEYNERMNLLINDKNRVVRLSEKNDVTYKLCCNEHYHIKLKSNFIYNDYVSFTSKGNGKDEGIIKAIIVSNNGSISYNIAQAGKSGIMQKGIKQSEIKFIKRQGKK